MQQSEILITLVILIFVGFIFWLFSTQAKAKIRYRAEVQKELIARFPSAVDLSEFLNSDAGKLLISESKERERAVQAPPKSAKQHVLESIGIGILALSVGLAVFAVRGLSLSATIFTALGIGFLMNALVGYLLAKKWGFWDPPVDPSRTNVS